MGEVAAIRHWNTEHDFVAKITDINTFGRFGARTKRILVIMWQKKKIFHGGMLQTVHKIVLDACEIL